MPVDQPVTVRGVQIPAQPCSNEVPLAEVWVYRAQVSSQFLEHFKRNVSTLRARSQNGSRYRDAVLAAHFVVLGVRVGFLSVVCVTFVVNGTLDDVFRCGREYVEAGLHVKDLGTGR